MHAVDFTMTKVDAIVPCYNEAPRIGAVLSVLSISPHINSIVVVDDGSTDNSLDIAKKFPKVIATRLNQNIGKGGAIREGLKRVRTGFVLLLDADLSEITDYHIRQLIAPVVDGKFDVCVGVLKNHHPILHRLKRDFLPLLSGQRVLKTKILKEVLESDNSRGWGIEPSLNYFANINGLKITKIDLEGVKSPLNAKKRGVVAYVKRIFSYVQIYFAILIVHHS